MKSLWIIPLIMALLAAAALGICMAMKLQVEKRDIVTACIIVSLASLVGMVPAIVNRNNAQVDMVQASLTSTVVHLFVTIVLGAVAYAIHLVGNRYQFLFAILAAFWISLVAMAVVLSRMVRRMTPTTTVQAAGTPKSSSV